jgi:predicted RNase H-like HicB family nuclease
MIRTHELTVDDTETRQVFIRYLCMQGHLTEWQYVGEVPDISECQME